MKDPTGVVRIGCFGGFWGDSMTHAVGQFLRSREAESLDYLVSDYLAEVTMCILAKKQAGGKGGAIDDFAKAIWKPFGATLMQKQIKIVVNAGGLDPMHLKKTLDDMSAKMPEALRPVVAAVYGDDLKGSYATVKGAMEPFALDGGDARDGVTRKTPLPDGSERDLPDDCLTSNAYVGCGGIVHALAAGAHIVVTGRVVDSAMVLGPLVHEHAWRMQDFDRLAAGTIAGHVIECGAQCTGGNFTDWEYALQRKGHGGRLFENVGFPIVEVERSGVFVVTKPSGTGGIVSRLSVAEQLVYEVGDTAAYIVADTVCDLRNVKLEEVGKDRVRVAGVTGWPPSGRYKVSNTFADGYTANFVYAIAGPNALFKAKATTQSIIRRAKRMAQSAPFRDIRAEYFGAGELSSRAADATVAAAATEVVVRLSAHHDQARPLLLIALHIPSGSTGMAPGLFTVSNARSAPSQAVALRSSLLAIDRVSVQVAVGKQEPVAVPPALLPQSPKQSPAAEPTPAPPTPRRYEKLVDAPLYTVACCRSGDKADAANVGVVCREPEMYAYLATLLTPERVHAHLRAWFDHPRADTSAAAVKRFELPALPGFNFVLAHVLGGGGLASLKGDKQGKTIGSQLSGMVVPLPAEWVEAYQQGVGAFKARVHAKL